MYLESNQICSPRFIADGAPPAYEQLFGVNKMKNDVMKAKEGSSNRGVFAVKFCEIICGSGMLSVQFASLCHATFFYPLVACMIGLLILAALPITMIVIGKIKPCRLFSNTALATKQV